MKCFVILTVIWWMSVGYRYSKSLCWVNRSNGMEVLIHSHIHSLKQKSKINLLVLIIHSVLHKTNHLVETHTCLFDVISLCILFPTLQCNFVLLIISLVVYVWHKCVCLCLCMHLCMRTCELANLLFKGIFKYLYVL